MFLNLDFLIIPEIRTINKNSLLFQIMKGIV